MSEIKKFESSNRLQRNTWDEEAGGGGGGAVAARAMPSDLSVFTA